MPAVQFIFPIIPMCFGCWIRFYKIIWYTIYKERHSSEFVERINYATLLLVTKVAYCYKLNISVGSFTVNLNSCPSKKQILACSRQSKITCILSILLSFKATAEVFEPYMQINFSRCFIRGSHYKFLNMASLQIIIQAPCSLIGSKNFIGESSLEENCQVIFSEIYVTLVLK